MYYLVLLRNQYFLTYKTSSPGSDGRLWQEVERQRQFPDDAAPVDSVDGAEGRAVGHGGRRGGGSVTVSSSGLLWLGEGEGRGGVAAGDGMTGVG